MASAVWSPQTGSKHVTAWAAEWRKLGELFHKPEFGIGYQEEDDRHAEKGHNVLPHGPVGRLYPLAAEVCFTITPVREELEDPRCIR